LFVFGMSPANGANQTSQQSGSARSFAGINVVSSNDANRRAGGGAADCTTQETALQFVFRDFTAIAANSLCLLLAVTVPITILGGG
jgi:hypothetical protein